MPVAQPAEPPRRPYSVIFCIVFVKRIPPIHDIYFILDTQYYTCDTYVSYIFTCNVHGLILQLTLFNLSMTTKEMISISLGKLLALHGFGSGASLCCPTILNIYRIVNK